jgi:hypothetical protein
LLNNEDWSIASECSFCECGEENLAFANEPFQLNN